MTFLSKSRLQAHRQCPKRLWLSVHKPELLETTEADTPLMATGITVGEVARSLHPDGQLIATDRLSDALAETQRALHTGKPIFEATFTASDLLIRADLLLPAREGYDLVEVKSAASVKDYYYEDIAIQSWTAKAAGASIASVSIAHIDNQFLYAGDGNYQGLFKQVPMQEAIADIEPQIPGFIQAAKDTLSGKEPRIEVGDHCSQPFDCPYTDYCDPPSGDAGYPPEILPYGGTLARALRTEGYTDLRDVPEERLSKANHLRIWRVSKSGQPELDAEAGSLLRALEYPRYYVDFETLAPAIPQWANTRPFQQIPFQWSCHIERADGSLDHREFLATTPDDPRRAFAENLIAAIGNQGPILVYNAAFERSRMKELAELFPDLANVLTSAIERIVDLLPIARDHYYHPDMMGSWSIKKVLPTIAPDLAYDNLDVADGGMAQEAFSALLNPNITREERQEIIDSLLAYCQRDTLAMVRVSQYFSKPNKKERLDRLSDN